MTMGNHECSHLVQRAATAATPAPPPADFKMAAYMTALQQISGADLALLPLRRHDPERARRSSSWSPTTPGTPTQQTWLTTQLTDADANAKYTFVSKHHPDGNTDQTYFQTIYNLVTAHKYTLFLTGHSHEYKHQYTDHARGRDGPRRRAVRQSQPAVVGLPARSCSAPTISIYVTVYDQATGNVQDSFSVPPQ